MMMKRLYALLLILTVANTANATLTMVASGPGPTFTFGLEATGEPALQSGLITFEGPLSVDASGATIVDIPGISNPPFIEDISDDPIVAAYLLPLGIENYVAALYYEIIDVSVLPASIPDGMMIDNILVTCEQDCWFCGTITLVDASAGKVLGTMATCIPEPATIALLWVGSLVLLRRPHRGGTTLTEARVG